MCKFILQIEVDSIDEAERILASLRHSAAPAVVQQINEQVNAGFSAGDMTDAAAQGFRDGQSASAAEAPKRRGRPRKEQAAPLAEQNTAHEAANSSGKPEKSESEQPPYSIADVREALMGVQAGGIGDVPRQLALLQKYGANRVTELKPENYAAFIADCKAA